MQFSADSPFEMAVGDTYLDMWEDPDVLQQSASLKTLFDFWQRLRTGTALPARADFLPEHLRPWLGLVSLADVAHEPRRFRWRNIATGVTERLGRDMSGRWFDEVYEGPTLATFVAAYSLAVDRREPVGFGARYRYLDKQHLSTRMLHLPLASNGRDVDMILIGNDYSGSGS